MYIRLFCLNLQNLLLLIDYIDILGCLDLFELFYNLS